MTNVIYFYILGHRGLLNCKERLRGKNDSQLELESSQRVTSSETPVFGR